MDFSISWILKLTRTADLSGYVMITYKNTDIELIRAGFNLLFL